MKVLKLKTGFKSFLVTLTNGLVYWEAFFK